MKRQVERGQYSCQHEQLSHLMQYPKPRKYREEYVTC